MKLLKNNVLVRIDMLQKQSVLIHGMRFQFVPQRWKYAQDGRVNNPVLAAVVQAGDDVPLKTGEILLLSHNIAFDAARETHFGFVIPYDRWILATVDQHGELVATPENLVCKRVPMPNVTVGDFYLPETAQKCYPDRVECNGEVLGILKWADYEVFYNWNGEERRRIIVWKSDVICKIKEAV